MKIEVNAKTQLVAKVRTVVIVGVIGGLAAACSDSGSGFNDPIEDAIGDPLVMMGLKVDPNKEEIEYGPRSPLVMPAESQTADLPAPYDPPDSYGELWPDDPDERAKREFKEMQKAALDVDPRDVEYPKPMMPSELRAWGQENGRTTNGGTTEATLREVNKTVGPRELLDRRADPNKLRSEPARATLTEPPPGYRTPAPPVAGYDETEEKKGFFSNWFKRGS